MIVMDPVFIVLIATSSAVAVSALGVLPALADRPVPKAWLGLANAAAAGAMLGAAQLLGAVEHLVATLPGGAAAISGIVVIAAVQRATGSAELDLDAQDRPSDIYPYQVVVRSLLHGACEGVAIGAAAALDLRLGLVLIAAIAAHNGPESMGLCAVLRARGVRAAPAAGLAVAADLGQVLFAVAGFALISAEPALLAPALGFAAGSMAHLAFADLLPSAYREAGVTGIAVSTSVALGVVVLLHGALG